MLQNRVNPKGEIFRTEARGTLMGNRGVIHDANKNIVRTFKHQAWITCSLQFKDKHRAVMLPDRWTELFFLDEATAFAAGHRPCCECRRKDFNQFKSCWIKGNPKYNFESKVSIREIDAIVHEERIDKTREKITYLEEVENIPSGTFIIRGEDFFLFDNDLLYRWSPLGYEAGIPISMTGKVEVLTPKSIVNTFKAGYKPGVSMKASG